MKNSRRSILILIIVVFLLVGNTERQDEIDKILHSSEYSYLPKEAKRIIEEAYYETGELVLTEKNKEPDKPYLNPEYVEYLMLSEEEKANIEVLPDVYVNDYRPVDVEAVGDAYYNISNIGGKSYVTPFKNQGSLGVCWAMSTIESAESFVMLKDNKPYNASTTQLFSVRQLDYATSKDGLYYQNPGSTTKYIWNNPKHNAGRSLGAGGNFRSASIMLASGLSLVSESVMPWNVDKTVKIPGEVLNRNNSLYEVTETISLPAVSAADATSSNLDNFVENVKQYMTLYGGPYVGTLSPQSSCGFKNIDGTQALVTDDCQNTTTNKSLRHALQIIGWDDNYTYSYCDAGTTHTSVSASGTCSSGTKKSGSGAFILRNSWGDSSEYKIFYLTYDSYGHDVGFIKNMSSTSTREWDNLYNVYAGANDEGYLYLTHQDILDVTLKDKTTEKIEKVKFYASISTSNRKATYKVSIETDKHPTEYKNIKTIEFAESGVKTFDLSSYNIMVGEEAVKITISSSDGYFYTNSIELFTSNQDKSKKAYVYASEERRVLDEPLSNENPLFVSGDNYWYLGLDLSLRNIPANSNISYRLKNATNTYETFASLSNKYVLDGEAVSNFSGNVSTTYGNGFNIGTKGYGNTFTMEVLADGEVVASFPVKFSGQGLKTSSTIRLYANNATGRVKNLSLIDRTNKKFDANGTYIGYSSSDFFNGGKYITGWNTKADGTGTTYTLGSEYEIFKDMDLYAIWSSDLAKFSLVYSCLPSMTGCSGYSTSGMVEHGAETTIINNHYTKTGYAFLYFNSSGSVVARDAKIYYEGESVSSTEFMEYPVFNGGEYNLYPVFSNDYVTVTFNANGGSGTMRQINVPKGVDTRIKKNSYAKSDYNFSGWNTKADGTGTLYSEDDFINLTSDITLYAQWRYGEKTIVFNANGGVGSMGPQDITGASGEKLLANSFTRVGYVFRNWNTKADGTGTTYTNQQLTSTLGLTGRGTYTLYAQWDAITYIVRFNGNGGTGSMADMTLRYDETRNLTANTFTLANNEFKGWNTKADGTGTNYANGQSVKNLTSVNGTVITLYAKWERVEKKIIYHANGGEGSDITQVLEFTSGEKLRNNTYTRVGYEFKGWNTKADGTGVGYANQQLIVSMTLDAINTNLYAVWEPITYTIRFNGNGGTGSMADMTVRYDQTVYLTYNTYSKVDYNFAKWSILSDGSGLSFTNGQAVRNLTNIKNLVINLYAIWVEGPEFSTSVYSIDDGKHYIRNIPANTSIGVFKNNFSVRSGYSLDVDMNGKEAIYTRSRTKVYLGGSVILEYINIVHGDINGDGKISTLDSVRIRNHIMGQSRLTDEVDTLAGDMNRDSKISALDSVAIRNIIMGR